MAELKLISPLLSNMEVVENVSVRGGTSVYIIKSTKTQQHYVLKHISVPESQRQVDALLYTGATASREAAQEYYAQVVADYQTELETLEKLADSPNLDCYRSYQIVPKEDAVGYDVYLLAENRKTLADYLQENAVTQLTAVNLGLDLCNALNDLRTAGLIHRDVKPSNIYLSAQGHFTLGDLGIAKIDELKYCSMPEHMLSSYSAPELFSLVGTIEPTTDLYAAGLILYRIFNGSHGPFEDENTSAEAADKRRITGEALPAPMYADYELAEIILKACAFSPADRYQTPEELKNALMEYVKRNQVQDTQIVPPIVADPEPLDLEEEEPEEPEPPLQEVPEEPEPEPEEETSPEDELLNTIIASVHRDLERDTTGVNPIRNSLEESEEPEEDEGEPEDVLSRARRKKRSKVLPAILVFLLIAAAAFAVVYFFYLGPSTIQVENISLVDRNTTALVLQIDSKEKEGYFAVACTDAYGNSSRQNFVPGQQNVFIELEPDTQYMFKIEPLDGQTIEGMSTFMATTMAEANILSFTATPVSVTQAELHLTLEGADPGMWTVRYSAPGVEEQEATFTGNTTTIANLQTNTEYTFTLCDLADTHLTGATTATFSTVPSVNIGELSAAVSSSSAILSWTFTGEAPETWTVSINGPDGYQKSQVVTEPTATFEGLSSGTDYEVIISAPTMLQSGKATITPVYTKLSQLTATGDSSNYNVRWACEVDPTDNRWNVSYGITGLEPTVMEVEGNECSIPVLSLVPDADYTVTLSLANGEQLQGIENSFTFRSVGTDRFKSYGFDKAYIGMYVKPDAENWSVGDLKNGRTEFSVGETIAFALESTKILNGSDDEVSVLLVVRDQSGQVVQTTAYTQVWSDMWDEKLTWGSMDSPLDAAGSFDFEVYYNRRLVISQPFTVS